MKIHIHPYANPDRSTIEVSNNLPAFVFADIFISLTKLEAQGYSYVIVNETLAEKTVSAFQASGLAGALAGMATASASQNQKKASKEKK